MRVLRRGPLPVGRLGADLGVTRQAARKIADALEQRGYATTERDSRDTRQLNVTLTPVGRDYARAVIAVTADLNREVAGRVGPAQLAAADTVLRAALFDDSAKQRASQLSPPSGQTPCAAERGRRTGRPILQLAVLSGPIGGRTRWRMTRFGRRALREERLFMSGHSR